METGSTPYTLYDKFGRQLSRTLPATPEFPDRTEHTAYDEYGRLARKIDFKGQVTAFTYDDLGRVTERRHYPDAQPATPPARTYAFTYDAQGHQETVSRQEGTAPAALTTYGYDDQGRLATVASPEGTIAYEYDVHGRKTSTETASTRTEYAYDELGRLVGVTVTKAIGVKAIGVKPVFIRSFAADLQVTVRVKTGLTPCLFGSSCPSAWPRSTPTTT